MTFPYPIRQSIKHAIVSCGNGNYSSNPDPYVQPLEKKIFEVVDEFLTEIRKNTWNTFQLQKEALVLSNEICVVITKIFKDVFGIKASFSYGQANRSNRPSLIFDDLFSTIAKVYSVTFVWEPKNSVVYGTKSFAELLENQEEMKYSLEAHFDVLHKLASTGVGTDVMFKFSDECIIHAHSQVLSAYASPKLAEDAKKSHFTYTSDIYEMMVKFIYTSKFPQIPKDNITALAVLKEAATNYEIMPLAKWSAIELETNIRNSIEPEKDFSGYFNLAYAYSNKTMLKKCFEMAEKSPEKLKELLSLLTLENYDLVCDEVGTNTPVTMKGIMSHRKNLNQTTTATTVKTTAS